MSWSYSGDPSESSVDAIRYLIADTKEEDSFVQNEEIEWALSQTNQNLYAAASIVANALFAQFSALSDEEIGPLKFKYTNRAKNYQLIALKFDKLSETKECLVGIYGGGIDTIDKESNKLDPSLVQPMFSKGITDYINPIDERLE